MGISDRRRAEDTFSKRVGILLLFFFEASNICFQPTAVWATVAGCQFVMFKLVFQKGKVSNKDSLYIMSSINKLKRE